MNSQLQKQILIGGLAGLLVLVLIYFFLGGKRDDLAALKTSNAALTVEVNRGYALKDIYEKLKVEVADQEKMIEELVRIMPTDADRGEIPYRIKKLELDKYIQLEKTFRAQKDSLEKKKQVMLGLKTYQHLPVHLLEELANAMPDDVWFKEINQKGLSISIKGESSSFEAINQFRNRLLGAPKWFQNVNYPAANKVGRTVEFTISCDLKNSA